MRAATIASYVESQAAPMQPKMNGRSARSTTWRGARLAVAMVRTGPATAEASANQDTKCPAKASETLRSRANSGKRPTTMNSVATTTAVANANAVPAGHSEEREP